jgi:hypothetical protein
VTTIAPQPQPVRHINTQKPDGDAFLAQLRLETSPTPRPVAAPTTAPGDSGSVRIGGSGLTFPMSNFDPQAAPLVALLDAAFQSLHRDGLPMSVGGVSVQEYGLIRARLEKTPDTLGEMTRYRDDIEKLVRMINIAGGEGMEVPDDINELLRKWKEGESDPLMSRQPTDIPGLTRSNAGNVQFPTPQGPGSQQPAGGFPTSGNPFGFDAAGGASGAQRASGSGGSATERKLRELLNTIGANNPGRDVYEILTEVIRDVVDSNAYAHPEKAAAVAEIARILSTANTGYANSSIPELVRITDTPATREAHSISVELARMQPDQVTSINRDGEKAVTFLKMSNGDYVMQALKPVHLRLPSGETVRVEPFQATSTPRGSVVTIPGMSPIEIGRSPRQPTVVYPSDELGLTPRARPSFDATTIHAPNPGAAVPPYTPPASAGPSVTPQPVTEPDFSLPPPIAGLPIPDVAAMNRLLDRTMERVQTKLKPSPDQSNPPTAEQTAADVAKEINLLPPELRSFAGHMTSRWAEHYMPTDAFNDFMEEFDKNDFREPNWNGGKSVDKSEKSTSIGGEKLVGRLNRLLEAGERAGWPGEKLAVLKKGIETLAAR